MPSVKKIGRSAKSDSIIFPSILVRVYRNIFVLLSYFDRASLSKVRKKPEKNSETDKWKCPEALYIQSRY